METNFKIKPLGNRIANHWQPGDGQPLVSTCPADESVVWEGRDASGEQVAAAFESARSSQGSWWDQPDEHRIAIVKKYRDLVQRDADQLAELISFETGKVLWDSKTEVSAVVGKIDVSIDAYQQRRSTRQFSMNQQNTLNAVTRFKPHGVVAVLGPFNFPAHLPNGHIVPALIAGNTAVFKPSEQAPAVGQWMTEKWVEAGLPSGVLNLVQGGRSVGQAITANDQLDGLFFTGSSQVGIALHRQFADRPDKILALEMGGNNPLIVDEIQSDDAIAAAVYLTLLSAYLTAGQRCTNARRLIIVESHRSQTFIDALLKAVQSLAVGFPDQTPPPFYGTVISQAAGDSILQQQGSLEELGGKILSPMESLHACPALLSPGLMEITGVEGLPDQEIFGPLLQLSRVQSLGEAIELANATKYGLSAALFSENESNYRQFIHKIRAGVVNWNRQTTGASGKLPFGGCGLSGNHRPAAYYAADYCSFPVASLEAKKLELPATQLPGVA